MRCNRRIVTNGTYRRFKKIFDNYRKTGQLEMMSDDNIDDWEDTK